MKFYLNGELLSAEGAALKDAMQTTGYRFPCGGKGACGKCRVRAAALPVTDRDRRFFKEEELADGYRLACDKVLTEGVQIEALFRKESPVKKISDCDIVALLGDQTICIGIINETLIDSVVIEREGDAMADGALKTKAVRSVIAHEAIELFEKYGPAKANTIFVVASETMYKALTGRATAGIDAETVDASLFDLPADEVYLAPGGNAIDFLKKTEMPETTLMERAVRLATDIRFRSKL